MIRLSPGGKPTVSGHRTAQAVQRLLRDELPRVRAAATAWRNGLAGLLAGLLGFSLIKGRSDVSRLAPPWDVVVGGLLLAALLAGAFGAFMLLWAAHGRPAAVERRKLKAGDDHDEAMRARRALDRGIVLTLLCTALLVAAVGVTWYGPAKDAPRLQVTTPDGDVCGSIVRMARGTLTLKTAGGETGVELATTTGIRAVETCPTG
ncbi:hypothetical protein [Nonomuraea recticatena]|uniref:Uncharacterized protein n=1 Tax=Nonomuraea recticatena TaxID=46178 RepID=A0ABN3SLU3_9ACTN